MAKARNARSLPLVAGQSEWESQRASTCTGLQSANHAGRFGGERMGLRTAETARLTLFDLPIAVDPITDNVLALTPPVE